MGNNGWYVMVWIKQNGNSYQREAQFTVKDES